MMDGALCSRSVRWLDDTIFLREKQLYNELNGNSSFELLDNYDITYGDELSSSINISTRSIRHRKRTIDSNSRAREITLSEINAMSDDKYILFQPEVPNTVSQMDQATQYCNSADTKTTLPLPQT